MSVFDMLSSVLDLISFRINIEKSNHVFNATLTFELDFLAAFYIFIMLEFMY